MNLREIDNWMMEEALRVARAAPDSEIPVGAAIFTGEGKLLGSRHQLVENSHDITAHAEMLVLRDTFASLASRHLTSCTIAVTLEPCGMCSLAIREARIPRVVFGAFSRSAFSSRYDLLRDSSFGEAPEVRGGVLEPECSELLRGKFRFLRER